MKYLLALFRVGMVSLFLCSVGGAAIAQTPAQRLAIWSQAIMQHRIERAEAEREAEVGRLETMIKQMERQAEALHDAALNPTNDGRRRRP